MDQHEILLRGAISILASARRYALNIADDGVWETLFDAELRVDAEIIDAQTAAGRSS